MLWILEIFFVCWARIQNYSKYITTEATEWTETIENLGVFYQFQSYILWSNPKGNHFSVSESPGLAEMEPCILEFHQK